MGDARQGRVARSVRTECNEVHVAQLTSPPSARDESPILRGVMIADPGVVRGQRIAMLSLTILPLVGVVAAMWGLWGTALSGVDLALFFGFVGYGMRLLGFEPAPLLIGFVLGPMMEENLRRAMLLARGDYLALFQRPISATLLTLAILLLAWAVWTSLRQRSRARAGVVREEGVSGPQG